MNRVYYHYSVTGTGKDNPNWSYIKYIRDSINIFSEWYILTRRSYIANHIGWHVLYSILDGRRHQLGNAGFVRL